MHRLHHSDIKIETDSNYASIFSAWDRLFNSYTMRSIERRFSLGLGDKFSRSADHLDGGAGNDRLYVDNLDLTQGSVTGGTGFDAIHFEARDENDGANPVPFTVIRVR